MLTLAQKTLTSVFFLNLLNVISVHMWRELLDLKGQSAQDIDDNCNKALLQDIDDNCNKALCPFKPSSLLQ